MRGRIASVRDVYLGSEFESDTASGVTTITVADLADFDWENGGSVYLNGAAGSETISYTVDQTNMVLSLGAATTKAYTAGDPVWIYPVTVTRWATVISDLQEEEVSARVPHYLFDRVPTGLRDTNVDGETVEYEYDEAGDCLLRDLIGQLPIIDGSYIDPVTIPPPTTDGSPPSVSPTPTVRTGYKTLFVSWIGITNADAVDYDVHISTSSGFTPGAGTLYGTTPGTFVSIGALPAGTALVPGTTYYVKIIARDADGSAPASTEASGVPNGIAFTDVTGQIGGGNLIPNSSFESVPTAGTVPVGFVVQGTNLTPAPVLDTVDLGATNKHGSKVARVTNGTDTTGFAGVQQVSPYWAKVQPNVNHVLSCFYRAAAESPTFRVAINWYTSGSVFISQSTGAITNGSSTAWTRATLAATAPATAAFAQCLCWTINPANGSVHYFDAMQLEEADVPTAYAPRPDEILPGTIGTTEIADNAVTTPKLIAEAVAAGKIAADAVGATEIAAESIESEHIMAEQILADHIKGNQITAGKLETELALVTTLTTSGTGRRVQLNSDGFEAISSEGKHLISLPTDELEDAAIRELTLETADVEVKGIATFEKAGNRLTTGSDLKLMSAQANPSLKPSVTGYWDYKSLASILKSNPGQGIAYVANGGADFATPSYYTVRNVGLGSTIEEFNASTGAITRIATLGSIGQDVLGVQKLVVGGNHRIFVLSRNLSGGSYSYFVNVFRQSDFVNIDTWNVTNEMPGSFISTNVNISATLGKASDDSAVYVICHTNEASGSIDVVAHDPSASTILSTTTTSGATFPFAENAIGGFVDDGTAWYLMVSSVVYKLNRALNSPVTGAKGLVNADENFIGGGGAGSGLTRVPGDTGNGLKTYDASSARVYDHSDWTWTTESSNYYFAYSWVSGTNETALSPFQNVNMGFLKRAKVRITPAGRPSGITSTSYYVERGAASPGTAARRQTTTTYIDSETNTVAKMKNFDALGTTYAARTTTAFSAGTAAVLAPVGGTGHAYNTVWALKGDGEFRPPAGTTSQINAGPANAGDMVLDTDTNRIKVRINGVWEEFRHVSDYPALTAVTQADCSADTSLGTSDTAITGCATAIGAGGTGFYLILGQVDINFDSAAAGMAEVCLTVGGPPGTRFGIPASVGRLASRGAATLVAFRWITGAETIRIAGLKSGSGFTATALNGRCRLLMWKMLAA